jgi:nitrous oxidase accessory protein/Cu-processing system ATP-binding protein
MTLLHRVIALTLLGALSYVHDASATQIFDLSQAIAQAAPGDIVEVPAGVYDAPILIDKPLSLIGVGRPIIDGAGVGDIIQVRAPHVTVRGFLLRNSGHSLDRENAAISVKGANALIEDNVIEDALFGVYLVDAPDSVVSGNIISGKKLDIPRRGDGIRLWQSHGTRVEDNHIFNIRDVVIWFSDNVTIKNNRIEGGRYGLHFMYSDDNDIEGNFIDGNSVGAFLMYSKRLTLRGNVFAHNRGPSGYGVGLKDMDGVEASDNRFIANRVGIYLDNLPGSVDVFQHFTRNVFAYNDIGVSFQPAVQRNAFLSNSFLENLEQVEVKGGGNFQGNVFSEDGAGNYWSDYGGYDLDGDGIGDLPYISASLFENMIDREPRLRLFLMSPAQQAIEFASRAFPIVKPEPKFSDDSPLMEVSAPNVPPPPGPASGPMYGVAAGVLLVSFFLVGGGLLGALSGGRRSASTPPNVSAKPAMNNESAAISVRSITKRYGRFKAVDTVSFDIAPGQAVALWGPNGAGKSTIIKCLVGLLRFRGDLRVSDIRVTVKGGRTARKIIGYVPQELALYDDLTVTQTLRLFARLRKAPRGGEQRVLEEVDLVEHKSKRVHALSGGMKQRLALGVALLADPPILVLDEPTSNLDAISREAFLALLLRLKVRGKTILFSSHRREEVLSLADRVIMLSGGKLDRICAADEVGAEFDDRLTLAIVVPESSRQLACDTLEAAGYSAKLNGHAVLVSAERTKKADPLVALAQAGVEVHDFELRTE